MHLALLSAFEAEDDVVGAEYGCGGLLGGEEHFDEDEDAVAVAYGHVLYVVARLSVDIDHESGCASRGEGDRGEAEGLAAVVVDAEALGGGDGAGEEGVEGYGVLAEGDGGCRVGGELLLVVACAQGECDGG